MQSPHEYRKKDGTNVWHWRPDCSGWPVEGYATHSDKPYHGELCDECRTFFSPQDAGSGVKQPAP